MTTQTELTPDKYLSKNELSKLLTTVTEKATLDKAKGRTVWPRIEMMIQLASNTGMRVAELVDIQVHEVNTGHEPSVYVSNGKGGKPRLIPISNQLKKRLKDFINANELKPTDCLFNVNGRQYSTMGLQQQFKKAARAAGLDSMYSIHSLRHTYGTYLYEKEKDLRMVQRHLGHASLATVQIYVGVSKERSYQAVNGLYD
ncbi:MAG: site-specific integrase [Balneolales bacterium]